MVAYNPHSQEAGLPSEENTVRGKFADSSFCIKRRFCVNMLLLVNVRKVTCDKESSGLEAVCAISSNSSATIILQCQHPYCYHLGISISTGINIGINVSINILIVISSASASPFFVCVGRSVRLERVQRISILL